MLSHTLVFCKLTGPICAQVLANSSETSGQFQPKGSEFLFQQAHYPGLVMAGTLFAQQAGIDQKAAVPVDMIL